MEAVENPWNFPSKELFGFPVRNTLHPGEQTFFQNNPTVAGMAAESNDIILNPWSPPGTNHAAVAKNEALRLKLRQDEARPDFPITEEQRDFFQGTAYEGKDDDIRATILARAHSKDPSIRPTTAQMEWLSKYLRDKNE